MSICSSKVAAASKGTKSRKTKDSGCVSTPSQIRDSEAGFEIRVFATLILKKILASCRDQTHFQKRHDPSGLLHTP